MRASALLVLPLLVAWGNALLTGEWDDTDEDVVENTCSDAIDCDGTSGAFATGVAGAQAEWSVAVRAVTG